jgi:hypothetical protein
MKSLFCLIISLFLFEIIFGQADLQMIPISHQEEIVIKDDQINNKLLKYSIYSDNDRNLATVEVFLPDFDKEEKAQRDIIKLFGPQGNLLGVSVPVELYDWYIKPMGDNETVLVTLIGLTEHSYIKMLKINGDSIKETKTIRWETGSISYDIDDAALKFVVAFSPVSEGNDQTGLTLYDHNGSAYWSKTVDCKDIRDVKIINDCIVLTSKGFDGNIPIIQVLGSDSKLLFQEQTGGRIGDYEIEYSVVQESAYFATASEDQVFLYDLNFPKRINVIESQLDGGINEFLIDRAGTVIAVNNNGIFLETLDQHKLYRKVDLSSCVPHLTKQNGKIILESWTPEKSEFYEIRYNK